MSIDRRLAALEARTDHNRGSGFAWCEDGHVLIQGAETSDADFAARVQKAVRMSVRPNGSYPKWNGIDPSGAHHGAPTSGGSHQGLP